MKELFNEFQLTKDSKVEIKEFKLLMLEIDDKLIQEEIEYIFNKFDSDGDNQISFEEFEKWLEVSGV